MNMITPEFMRYFVGLDSAVDKTNYPPHNLEQLSTNEYLITLAVAGFSKDDISVETHLGRLKITGKKGYSTSSDIPYSEPPNYIHRGISLRDFVKEFRLAEYFEVKSIKLNNGLLEISIVKNEPEWAKPKQIEFSD